MRSLLLVALLLALLGGGCSSRGARTLSDGTWQGPREASLPEGFPAPSQPGVIEVKSYPPVRGAWRSVDGSYDSGPMKAFFPLFRHIKRRGIEMTAPVVADYPADVAERGAGRMEMAFLYESSEQGAAGPAPEGIEVRDSEPRTVVSIGVDGAYKLATMRRALKKLDAWLADPSNGYERAGPPRRLMYQQPLPFKRLYSEVQVPVRPVTQAP